MHKKPENRIRVLVVDDSLVCREMLSALLNQAPDLLVIGTAKNGKEAIELNRLLKPDLVTMDAQMPGLDGFETIAEIMAAAPVPILVVTASPVHQGVDRTFRALAEGALDLVKKPEFEGEGAELLRQKVRLLAPVRVVHRRRTRSWELVPAEVHPVERRRSIVAIAASTGGPKALLDILKPLPRDFPASFVVTQHIPEGFSEGLAHWLNSELSLEVAEARDGDRLLPGRVLIAPARRHLVLRSAGEVALSDDPPLGSHKPSGTIMFRSIARLCATATIGVVLTGMGRDGADGLLDLSRAGGLCLAQDEASSLVFGMPKAAIDLGAAHKVLDIAGIRDFLLGNRGLVA